MKNLLSKIWKAVRQMRGPDVKPGQIWEHTSRTNAFEEPHIVTFEVLEVKDGDARGVSRNNKGNEETTVHSHEWLRMMYSLKP